MQNVTLDNGMRIIAIETPEYHSIYLQLRLFAGPSIEDKARNGISHFVEHMVLEGGKLHPDKNRFDEEIDILGGGYNASTSHYILTVRISVPDTHLKYALDYLYDVSFNALFPEERLESERSAILDEIHNYNTRPNKRFYDFYDRNRYNKGISPMPICGTASVISKMSRKKLMDWYKYIFVPNNMTLGVVGNVDPELVVKCVEDSFGKVKSSGVDFRATPNTYDLSHSMIRTQTDAKEKKSIGIMSFQGLERKADNYHERVASLMLESILVSSRSSLLYTKLRKERGLIYHIWGEQSFDLNEPGTFDIGFTTSDDRMIEVYETVLSELRLLLERSISEKELEIARQSSVNSIKMGYSSIDEVLNLNISSVFWFNQVIPDEEAIAVRESISLDEVNSLLKKIIQPDQATIINRVSRDSLKERLNSRLIELITV